MAKDGGWMSGPSKRPSTLDEWLARPWHRRGLVGFLTGWLLLELWLDPRSLWVLVVAGLLAFVLIRIGRLHRG